jgi:hypothetical protein
VSVPRPQSQQQQQQQQQHQQQQKQNKQTNIRRCVDCANGYDHQHCSVSKLNIDRIDYQMILSSDI